MLITSPAETTPLQLPVALLHRPVVRRTRRTHSFLPLHNHFVMVILSPSAACVQILVFASPYYQRLSFSVGRLGTRHFLTLRITSTHYSPSHPHFSPKLDFLRSITHRASGIPIHVHSFASLCSSFFSVGPHIPIVHFPLVPVPAFVLVSNFVCETFCSHSSACAPVCIVSLVPCLYDCHAISGYAISLASLYAALSLKGNPPKILRSFQSPLTKVGLTEICERSSHCEMEAHLEVSCPYHAAGTHSRIQPDY